jgi:hypothetical protein
MSKFNLSKSAKVSGYQSYNKMLEKHNKEFNLGISEKSKNVNLDLNKKDFDPNLIFEKHIESSREGTDSLKIVEKSLNESKKVYNEKRLDESTEQVSPMHLISESYDQNKSKDIRESENESKKDTLFWDKYVNTQMLGEPTNIKKQVKETQLSNNPERFEGLSGKENPVDRVLKFKSPKMVTASLKKNDAELFYIYAMASYQNRELNKKEKQMVENINNEKKKIISQFISPYAMPPSYTEKGSAPRYDTMDDTYIVQQNGKYIVYDGDENILDESYDQKWIESQYPKARRDY